MLWEPSDSHVTVSERSESEALIQFTAANIKGLPGEAGLQPALVSALRSQTSTVGDRVMACYRGILGPTPGLLTQESAGL